MSRTRKIITAAIDIYGEHHQQIQALSELAELSKEISDSLLGRHDRDAMIDEIADVKIMLAQLEIIYNIENAEVEEQRDFKINRLNRRVGCIDE